MDFSILTTIFDSINNFIETEVMGIKDGLLNNFSQESINRFRIILHIIISSYAIYLSVKCKGGFYLLDVLLSLFCAPCYIAYRLIYKC